MPDFYTEAFARNIGIFSRQEQEKLRASRVAIAGMGGVGGIHLVTLARMGLGKFNISDDDTFEAANINRQYGATVATLGKSKSAVMGEIASSINPEIETRMFPKIEESNIDSFLDGVDVAIDGIDFFNIEARLIFFGRARSKGIHVVTAGPLGFGSALIVFAPDAMSFEDYLGISPGMSREEMVAAFAVGLAPKGLHRDYMDFSKVDLRSGAGPSTACACALCANLAAVEAVNILLKRRPVRAAPHYFQFDPYRQAYKKGYLLLGGKNPLQYLKRKLLLRFLAGQSLPPRTGP